MARIQGDQPTFGPQVPQEPVRGTKESGKDFQKPPKPIDFNTAISKVIEHLKQVPPPDINTIREELKRISSIKEYYSKEPQKIVMLNLLIGKIDGMTPQEIIKELENL